MDREGLTSPELQLTAISEHCDRRGLDLVEVIEDVDKSGRFWKSRQVERAVTMIEFGAAEVLVVARWSRVARNRLDWAIAVDRVESVGGRLESALEPVDDVTPAGRFARGMLAELAAFESDRYAQMWRETRMRRLSQGLPAGGHRERFGYRLVERSSVPHPISGPIVAKMYRRYTAGDSFETIRRRLNDMKHDDALPGWPTSADGWTNSHVRTFMLSGHAAGLLHTAEHGYLPAAHAALISQRQWKAFLHANTVRRRAPYEHLDRATLLLERLVWCACGRMMAPTTAHGYIAPNSTYNCNQHLTGGQRSIAATVIDPEIRAWLARLSTDPDAASAARRDQHAHASARWADARRLARDVSMRAITAPSDRQAKELQAAETEAQAFDPGERARALLDDWTHLSIALRRARIRQLISRVIVHQAGPNRTEIIPTWTNYQPLQPEAEQLLDDLDGSPASSTVEIEFGDEHVQLVLSERNHAELERILAPYISAARPCRVRVQRNA